MVSKHRERVRKTRGELHRHFQHLHCLTKPSLKGLGRIFSVPMTKRVKGGKKKEKTKEELIKDIRREWRGETFHDTEERARRYLEARLEGQKWIQEDCDPQPDRQ